MDTWRPAQAALATARLRTLCPQVPTYPAPMTTHALVQLHAWSPACFFGSLACFFGSLFMFFGIGYEPSSTLFGMGYGGPPMMPAGYSFPPGGACTLHQCSTLACLPAFLGPFFILLRIGYVYGGLGMSGPSYISPPYTGPHGRVHTGLCICSLNAPECCMPNSCLLFWSHFSFFSSFAYRLWVPGTAAQCSRLHHACLHVLR